MLPHLWSAGAATALLHTSSLAPPTLLQERAELLEHIERRPEAMWRTGTQWSFRNEAKVYGSPMLDSAWVGGAGGGEDDPLPGTLQALKDVEVPLKAPAGGAGRGRGGGKGRGKRAAGGPPGGAGSASDTEPMQL
jgi:hypothetical protein